jgi:hypothetical protein
MNLIKIKNLKLKIGRTRRRKLLISLLTVVLVLTSVQIWNYFYPETASADTLLSFDEGYGSTVNDSSGSAEGTITGAAWKTDDLCRSEKCLYFDGASWINFGDENSYDFSYSDTFTIQFWFRHAPATSAQVIMQKYEGTGADGGFRVQMESDGDISFGVDNDNSGFPTDSVTSTAADYDDNSWHHVSAVRNGTTGMYLYIDGNLVASNTSLNVNSGTLANDDTFYIGDSDGTDNGDEFVGFLDEVKIYTSTARSSDEVKADLAGSTPSRGTSVNFGPDESYLSDGLVGYWKMDEADWGAPNCSTDVVFDYSGNVNNGIACPSSIGPTGGEAGKFGNGITFDASDDYVQVADNATIRFNSGTQDFSIFTWVKRAGTGSTGILQKLDGGNDGYAFRFLVTNLLRFQLNAISITSTTALTSTTDWYHVGVVVNRQGNAQLYINGVPDGTPVAINGEAMDTTVPLSLGRAASSLNGTLDEARVYNRALSPAEVADLYNWAPGPTVYYPFDENSGTSTVYDVSGNGLIGTLQGTWTEADWVPGKFGSALEFDRAPVDENDRIDSGAADILDDTPALSVSAWVNVPGDSTGTYTIASKANTSGTVSGWRFVVSVSSSNFGLGFLLDYDGATDLARGESVPTSPVRFNQWVHVAMTWGGSSSYTDVKMYVNGTEVLYGGTNTNGDGSRVPDTAHNLYLGNSQNSANDFDGYLDDIRIYNYARTPAQIIEDMNAGHPAPGSPVGSALAHWQFDEGALDTCSGGTNDFCDSSIHGIDLLGSNAGFVNSGKFGRAFNGNGTAYARTNSVFNQLNLLQEEDISISTWFRSDSASSPASDEFILARGVNVGTEGGYALYTNTSGYACFGLDDDGTWDPETSVCSTSSVYDTSWHHITAVRNTSENTIKIYLDGEENNTGADTSAGTIYGNGQWLYVGSIDTSDNGNELNGDLDELKIFKLALNADQVKAEYNQGSASVWGALSTDSSGNPSWGATDAYCPPGQGSACVGPIAEWLLDEKTGTGTNVIKDTSGSGYDLDTLGSITNSNWTRGKFGSAMYFNGVDDRLSSASGEFTALDGAGSATWSFWLRPDFNPDTTTNRGVFNSTCFGLFYNQNQDDFTVLTNTSSGSTITWNTTGQDNFSSGEWHQVTVTYDGANVNFYWDGVYQQSDPQTGTCDNQGAVSILIGWNAASSSYWLGAIDTVRVYNYARTPAQIAWEYNRGGPVGWWQLDDGGTGNGLTLYDNSGFGNNGTSVDGGGTALDCTVAGKRNTACQLDGSNDYITIGDANDLYDSVGGGVSSPFTISAWINRSSYNTIDVIVSKDDDFISRQTISTLCICNAVDNVSFNWTDGFGNALYCSISNTTITSAGWYHVVGMFDI